MLMSEEQWRRLDIVKRIEGGELNIAEGALALGMSSRQMKRVRKRVKQGGAAGVTHGNRGRAPAHKTSEAQRSLVVRLWREKYAGFNDQHFTEKLREAEEISLSRPTVRRVLRAAGIGAVRRRRPQKHRRRRDRRPQAGQMMLWDGSRHDWLEGRGPRLCLMGAIDDATGELLPGAHFVEQECTVGYLRVLRDVVAEKGIPLSAYMDQHSALKRNDKHWTLEEQLAGRQEPTQVKAALDELGIQTIYALSPQAKGRVERLWGTLQDRLVSEFRLAKTSTAAEADCLLARYRAEHNRKFAIAPAEAGAAWRVNDTGRTADEVCALRYARQVQNNNTVRIDNHTIDIPPQVGRASFAKTVVEVRHLLRGGFRVYHQGQLIAAAKGPKATGAANELRSATKYRRAQERERQRRQRRAVTESLTC
jgi:hypothetical protein